MSDVVSINVELNAYYSLRDQPEPRTPSAVKLSCQLEGPLISMTRTQGKLRPQ